MKLTLRAALARGGIKLSDVPDNELHVLEDANEAFLVRVLAEGEEPDAEAALEVAREVAREYGLLA